jgi:ATP-dependent metalloprotease
MLIILSVFFENSGIMKAVPKDTQFEITDGKVVRFSDVQGVDEAKDVSPYHII